MMRLIVKCKWNSFHEHLQGLNTLFLVDRDPRFTKPFNTVWMKNIVGIIAPIGDIAHNTNTALSHVDSIVEIRKIWTKSQLLWEEESRLVLQKWENVLVYQKQVEIFNLADSKQVIEWLHRSHELNL